MSHMESYDSSEPTSVVTNSSTVEGEHTIQEEEEVGLIGRAVSSSSSSPMTPSPQTTSLTSIQIPRDKNSNQTLRSSSEGLKR
ncbi:Uncharacterized protein FKW44_008730 [Caligus rogercresseyi]|uniref:Uncharacterized protein n=1 Tax=Caligus rogercresseyi TaxID=217165 RepID=A0A7T8QUG8_CALRO|nr:Uncharacterized protein FKW44_008730 [Caligus rogercresseyi]